jgi:hypothetical protein
VVSGTQQLTTLVVKKLKYHEAKACGVWELSAEMARVVESDHADEPVVAQVKTADTTV